MEILVETSARHIHLTQKDFTILFGEEAKLNMKKKLSQPGQFACKERVSIVGSKNEIRNVSILGPFRDKNQVEISITDAIKLGINAPIRLSGDVENTPGCVLIGPKGKLEIFEGVIIAKRHIHLDEKSAREFNLKDKQIVKVKVKSNHRPLIFEEVVVRVDKNFLPAMHIDTDESNAANVTYDNIGLIIV